MTTAALLILVTALNLLLAVFVLVRAPRSEVNRVFAVTAFSVSLWTLTNALFQITDSVAAATLWAQISYVSALLIAASFLHFAWTYPQRSSLVPHAKLGLWGATFLTSALPFVPHLVIRSIELGNDRGIQTNAGIYAIAFFMMVTSTWAFKDFYGSYRTHRSIAREQLQYVLFGTALTAICGLTFNLFLPLFDYYAFVWAGPASSVFFVGFTVYAIVAKRLFDIRVVIKRTLVYSLLLTLVAGGYSGVEYVLTESLKRYAGSGTNPIVSNIGGAIVVSLLVSPVRQWLERKIDQLLFGRRHRRHSQRRAAER